MDAILEEVGEDLENFGGILSHIA